MVDVRLSLAEAAAGEFGAAAYADVGGLPEDIQLATVVTPPMHHYGPVKALLELGVPVLCEKPLTMDVAQAEELAALAERKGLPLLIGFKMRFEPVFARARELVGAVGPLRAVVTGKMQPYHPGPIVNWHPDVGAMYELSVHDFDLVRFITGLDPRAVLATLRIPEGWTRENGFSIQVRYTDDVMGSHTGVYVDSCRFMQRDFTAQFIGERGYVTVQRPDRISVHLEEFTVEQIGPPAVDPFVAELTNFRDTVLGRAEPFTTARDGVIATRLVEAAFASGQAQGGWVDISE